MREATRDPSVRVWATDGTADWLLWRIPDLRGRLAYDVRFELYDMPALDRIVRYGRLQGDWPAAVDGYRRGRRRPARTARRAPCRARSARRAPRRRHRDRRPEPDVSASTRLARLEHAAESPGRDQPFGQTRAAAHAAPWADGVETDVPGLFPAAGATSAEAVAVTVATATRLPPSRRVAAHVDAGAREASTLELVTVAASNVAIALLVAVSCALLALGHRERMETALFVVALALAPAGVAVARRQLRRAGRERYTSLALLDVAGLSAAVLVARAAAAVAGTDAVPWVLLVGTAAVVGLDVVAYRRPLLLPGAPQGTARTIAILGVCALLACAVASFYPRSLFTPERLWLCVLVVSVVAAVRALRIPAPTRRVWRRAIDAVVLVTTALVVSDVNGYSSAFRYDYDFFLGPVNAMRHGHPLLVDTFSQYGVGLFYALTGAFHAIPLSYGGLQFVLCIAYAAEFALVYGVLRLACRSQLVAVLGLAVALVANLAVSPQYIASPSVGPLRFGLPWVVILAGTLRARSVRSSTPPRRRDAPHRRRLPQSGARRPSSTRSRPTRPSRCSRSSIGPNRRASAACASPSGSPPRWS